MARAAAPEKTPGTTAHIDWPDFLHRNDMVWPSLPDGWDTGAFLGNGDLGTIFWQDADGSLHFEMSRTSLYDHRGGGANGKLSTLYGMCRLPNGYFSLSLGAGKPTGEMRLDLWNAEARGQIVSAGSTWKFRSFAPAKADLIVVELDGSKSAEAPQIAWHPETALSTRQNTPANVLPYPPQEQTKINGVDVSVQEMPEDARYLTAGKGAGQYATAWTSARERSGHIVYFISTKLSYPGRTAASQAVEEVLKARRLGVGSLEEQHRALWHNYYGKSFLSVPDAAMESFYWIQMYKMASLSRQNGPVIDLLGPWFRKTGWPDIWWNLNLQMTYWPFYEADHLEEAESLNRSLWAHRASLADNASPYREDSLAVCRSTGQTLACTESNEIGDLPWVMHDLWLYYRYSMDDRFLREQLFPLMKGTFEYLWHLSIQHEDGSITLPPSPSPEYTDKVENSTFSSACYRWLAHALIDADTRLKLNDPVAAQARRVLNSLAPYAVDPATGVMIGNGMPLEHSHRHWSHLFMIYPFHEWSWSDPKLRPLMQKSLDHWAGMTEGFTGFSYVTAASMYAGAGDPDRANAMLQTFLRKSPLPNTLYREGSPVIETPLGFARSVQELTMTSDGGVIRVFPGIPPAWQEASFASLRAEGAFLVSAARKSGHTQQVTITSLAGEPCLVSTGLIGVVKVNGARTFHLRPISDGVVEVDLKKGETVTLYSGTDVPVAPVQPVERVGGFEPWGAVRGRND